MKFMAVGNSGAHLNRRPAITRRMHSPLRRRVLLGAALTSISGGARAATEPLLRATYPRLLERPEHAFGYQVLELALQRSGQPHELRLGEAPISARAAWPQLETGQLDVIDNGSAGRLADRVDPVPIPLDFGLGGCRMLLGRADVLQRLKGVRHLEQLRSFVLGQGIDWTDTRILRNAGLRVEEGDFSRLLRMLEGGRFDLLPLGADEAHSFLESDRAAAPDVEIEPALGLFYPYPRIFFVTRGNTALMSALTRGLRAAHADGSLAALLARTPGIGPILRGQRALPRHLIAIANPWLPTALRNLQPEHFHPALRAPLRSVWTASES
jgi:hypothetical protein